MGGKCWTQNYYPDAEIPGKFKLRMDYRDVVSVSYHFHLLPMSVELLVFDALISLGLRTS